MRNKLLSFLRVHNMVQPGNTVICAVSGGADSMALLWAMLGLGDKLKIRVEAAHFNHHLRGAESQRDEDFVAAFCRSHGIVCHIGGTQVKAGEKGLEAAARTARYAFLQSLPGIIATAHTADDNAETMLMHLIRGTGLKGLGGIAPRRENIIRPMLNITRQEVLTFLEGEGIPYITDSSNATDDFLRNRIRHHVMPLLKEENPSLSENLSATAMRLRQDEAALDALAEPTTDVEALRKMPGAVQTRALSKLLVAFGVKEPEAAHIELLRKLVNSENPSAKGQFPGAVIGRSYGRLIKLVDCNPPASCAIPHPGVSVLPEWGIKVSCTDPKDGCHGYPVCVQGELILRGRAEGDTLKLHGGTKTLKKLFIDRKIPAWERERIPVLADAWGVVAVMDIGPNLERMENPNCVITIEKL